MPGPVLAPFRGACDGHRLSRRAPGPRSEKGLTVTDAHELAADPVRLQRGEIISGGTAAGRTRPLRLPWLGCRLRL